MSKIQRLHHNAFPVKNHEVTRQFYEDIIGLSLVAAWAEKAEVAGRERVYMHTFYELADGSALAFFQVASPVDDDFGRATRTTPLDHIAFSVDANTQEEIKSRLQANGVPVRTIDHGYVKSIYAVDPDGLNIEFSVDPENYPEIYRYKKERAHAELKRWLAGDHTPNNELRHMNA